MDEFSEPMTWLRDGVSLTLLLDLLPQSGPDSARIYAAEPADAGWVQRPRVA